jgi:hypothetical protein
MDRNTTTSAPLYGEITLTDDSEPEEWARMYRRLTRHYSRMGETTQLRSDVSQRNLTLRPDDDASHRVTETLLHVCPYHVTEPQFQRMWCQATLAVVIQGPACQRRSGRVVLAPYGFALCQPYPGDLSCLEVMLLCTKGHSTNCDLPSAPATGCGGWGFRLLELCRQRAQQWHFRALFLKSFLASEAFYLKADFAYDKRGRWCDPQHAYDAGKRRVCVDTCATRSERRATERRWTARRADERTLPPRWTTNGGEKRRAHHKKRRRSEGSRLMEQDESSSGGDAADTTDPMRERVTAATDDDANNETPIHVVHMWRTAMTAINRGTFDATTAVTTDSKSPLPSITWHHLASVSLVSST